MCGVRPMMRSLLALLLTFGGGYWYGGYVEAEAQQVEVDRLNAEARLKEEALGNALTATTNALRKTNEKAKLATKQRDDAIDSGALKLRVKTTCPVSATADATVASGSDTRTAEIQPETARAILAIGDEADTTVRKLNACLAIYNQTREMLNERKP